MKTAAYPAVLLLALAVGACSRESGPRDSSIEGAGADTTNQRTSTDASGSQQPGTGSYQTPTPDAVTGVPNPGGPAAAVGSLQPVNNSGVTGSVTFAQAGEGTLVSVSVTAAPAAGSYSLALHEGECTRAGRRVAALSPLTVAGPGIGAVTDTVALPAATLMDGRHVLVLRSPNAGPTTPPVACATVAANPAAR